jgi:hypothetical protein
LRARLAKLYLPRQGTVVQRSLSLLLEAVTLDASRRARRRQMALANDRMFEQDSAFCTFDEGQRCEFLAFVCGRGVSQRRACVLMSVARSTLRYESCLVSRDAPVAVLK